MHNNNIIHRDIKPQNVLFDKDGNAKLTDFGVSAFITPDNDLQTKSEGTYFFMSPDSIDKNGVGKGFSGKAADVWALGVTFYAFTFYQVPWVSENIMEAFEMIEKKPYFL